MGVEAVPPRGAVVLIDWGCGFCQRARAFAKRRARCTFRWVALSSEEGKAWLRACGRDPMDHSTVVVVERGATGLVCSERSRAALRVLRKLRLPWCFGYAAIVVPRPVRDAVYDWISKNRHRF